MSIRQSSGGHTPASYLARPPERLVLEGYRLWAKGFGLHAEQPWHEAGTLYREVLGQAAGARAISLLADFVAVLGRCAQCPLSMLRPGACALCRDEALVVGLVAAIQHCDEEALEFCLDQLTRPQERDRVAFHAAGFALGLKALDAMLLPVPLEVVRRVCAEPAPPPPTLH